VFPLKKGLPHFSPPSPSRTLFYSLFSRTIYPRFTALISEAPFSPLLFPDGDPTYFRPVIRFPALPTPTYRMFCSRFPVFSRAAPPLIPRDACFSLRSLVQVRSACRSPRRSASWRYGVFSLSQSPFSTLQSLHPRWCGFVTLQVTPPTGATPPASIPPTMLFCLHRVPLPRQKYAKWSGVMSHRNNSTPYTSIVECLRDRYGFFYSQPIAPPPSFYLGSPHTSPGPKVSLRYATTVSFATPPA